MSISDMVPFKMSFPFASATDKYDPAQISFDYEYILLDNLVRPLVDLDETGDLFGDLAARFEWVGEELQFTMRRWDNGKGPEIISAEDAAASLKRLMIIGRNSHGNIADLLCHGKELKSLNDSCDGIEVRSGKLILKPGKRNPFLLSMLASIDFGMLSRENYDPISLKIISYANTTGPYGVKSDDGRGNIILRSNPRHYLWNEGMPQEVVLVPPTVEKALPQESLRQFDTNIVDFISSVDAAKGNDLFEKFGNGNEKTRTKFTEGIGLVSIVFSKKGINRLTKHERFAIGRKIREEYLSFAKPENYFRPAYTFFPTFGELTRDSERVAALKTLGETPNLLPLSKPLKIHIGLSQPFENFWKQAGPLISTDLIAVKKRIHTLVKIDSPEEMPDFSFASCDSGAFEDINLVSYTVTSGTFGQTPDEARAWLAIYQNEMDKDLRLKMLNELHFKALEEGILIPIATSSYGAAIRKPWKMNFSKFSATSPLWRITRD